MAAGAAAERSPSGLSPRLWGASELMQPGSEAITNAADGITSKSDESHLRPTMAVYAPFASSIRQTLATPILSCAAIGLPRTARPARRRTLADSARAGARDPYCEQVSRSNRTTEPMGLFT